MSFVVLNAIASPVYHAGDRTQMNVVHLRFDPGDLVVAVKSYGYNYVSGTNNGTPGMNNGGTPRTNNDAPETNNDYRDFWRGCDRGRNDLND